MTKLKAVGPRVLVKVERLEETDAVYKAAAAVGLDLSHSRDRLYDKNAIVKGVVVDIGSTAWQSPVGDGTPWCQLGDTIYYARHAGFRPPEEELEDYLFINDEDVIGVITND